MPPRTERGILPDPEPVEPAKHILIANGFVQEGKLVRDFFRDGAFHDIVILSRFREGS